MSPRSVPCLFVSVLLFSCVSSVTLNIPTHNIVADERVELTPNYVFCGLNDIIILSAPVVNHNVTIFQLTKPNGDIRNLHITLSKNALIPGSHENSLVIKYNMRKKEKSIRLLNSYKLFNINIGQLLSQNNDIFDKHTHNMKENDFLIGPVAEEDHGNWVLSMYAHENGKWLEIFQVINIKIKEYIPPKERSKTLQKGDTFRFGFAYPIPYLESCEFTAPESTFDRWYDRDQSNLDHCMFVVNNVTKEDEGLWMVVGVGRIVYIAQTFLNVA